MSQRSAVGFTYQSQRRKEKSLFIPDIEPLAFILYPFNVRAGLSRLMLLSLRFMFTCCKSLLFLYIV
jgi:hypothetical protein